jgi:hypothetical protein
MKINQIVGEHKKGFKAKIYQKKQTVAPKKPLKPNEIEHPGHVDEAQVTPATVSAVDQNTGEVKLKNPDGTETNVAPDAMQKGPDGKLVTKVATAKPGDQVNIEKEMEEEIIGQQTAKSTRRIDPPNPTNTLFMDRKKFNSLTGAVASDGDPIRQTKTGREVDAAYASEPDNAVNRIGYFKADDGKMYMSLNVGHEWRLGPEAYRKVLGMSWGVREESGTHVDDKIFAGSKVGQKAGVAGQARGEPSRSQKAPLKGKLVGGMEEGMTPADKILLDKMLTIAGLK